MSRQDYIGLRVARWRDIAGLSQQELADRVGKTQPYISMLESGTRPITNRNLLIALATALGVSLTDLTAQPDEPRDRDSLALYSAVPALRGALDDEPDDITPMNVTMLAADVDRAMAARMSCDYPALAAVLPALVAAARLLADRGGRYEQDGLRLFVRAAICAALTIKPFGYIDLSTRLAERATEAARRLDGPAERAAAAFTAAQVALASGSRGGQRRSLATARHGAQAIGDIGVDDTLSWYGMLHLHAAMSAATLGLAADAAAHHAEAESTASRVSADPWRMDFGPANVGVWQVAIALENGEPGRAPEYARRVDRNRLRTTQRIAHLHINTARGLYLDGKPDAAVRTFLEADEVAQSELRSRPSVREIVGQMVRDSRQAGGSEELRDLAVRLGIDPLDPPDPRPRRTIMNDL